ncbi:MAG: hypothetical protein HYZ87_02055, partial [Candidatus Omnitrophica bacterium]|nr:hypothetical protein [Candidatus Omnitrophota bacterium]
IMMGEDAWVLFPEILREAGLTPENRIQNDKRAETRRQVIVPFLERMSEAHLKGVSYARVLENPALSRQTEPFLIATAEVFEKLRGDEAIRKRHPNLPGFLANLRLYLYRVRFIKKFTHPFESIAPVPSNEDWSEIQVDLQAFIADGNTPLEERVSRYKQALERAILDFADGKIQNSGEINLDPEPTLYAESAVSTISTFSWETWGANDKSRTDLNETFIEKNAREWIKKSGEVEGKALVYVELSVAGFERARGIVEKVHELATPEEKLRFAGQRWVYLLTDFSKPVLEEAKREWELASADPAFREKAEALGITFDFQELSAQNVGDALESYDQRIVIVHATNLYDALPANYLVSYSNKPYSILAQAYLPAAALKVLAEAGVPASELSQVARGEETLGDFLNRQKARLKDQFLGFLKVFSNAIKVRHRYRAIARDDYPWIELDGASHPNQILWDRLASLPRNAWMSDFKIGLQSIQQILKILHPKAVLEITQFSVLSPRLIHHDYAAYRRAKGAAALIVPVQIDVLKAVIERLGFELSVEPFSLLDRKSFQIQIVQIQRPAGARAATSSPLNLGEWIEKLPPVIQDLLSPFFSRETSGMSIALLALAVGGAGIYLWMRSIRTLRAQVVAVEFIKGHSRDGGLFKLDSRTLIVSKDKPTQKTDPERDRRVREFLRNDIEYRLVQDGYGKVFSQEEIEDIATQAVRLLLKGAKSFNYNSTSGVRLATQALFPTRISFAWNGGSDTVTLELAKDEHEKLLRSTGGETFHWAVRWNRSPLASFGIVLRENGVVESWEWIEKPSDHPGVIGYIQNRLDQLRGHRRPYNEFSGARAAVKEDWRRAETVLLELEGAISEVQNLILAAPEISRDILERHYFRQFRVVKGIYYSSEQKGQISKGDLERMFNFLNFVVYYASLSALPKDLNFGHWIKNILKKSLREETHQRSAKSYFVEKQGEFNALALKINLLDKEFERQMRLIAGIPEEGPAGTETGARLVTGYVYGEKIHLPWQDVIFLDSFPTTHSIPLFVTVPWTLGSLLGAFGVLAAGVLIFANYPLMMKWRSAHLEKRVKDLEKAVSDLSLKESMGAFKEWVWLMAHLWPEERRSLISGYATVVKQMAERAFAPGSGVPDSDRGIFMAVAEEFSQETEEALLRAGQEVEDTALRAIHRTVTGDPEAGTRLAGESASDPDRARVLFRNGQWVDVTWKGGVKLLSAQFIRIEGRSPDAKLVVKSGERNGKEHAFSWGSIQSISPAAKAGVRLAEPDDPMEVTTKAFQKLSQAPPKVHESFMRLAQAYVNAIKADSVFELSFGIEVLREAKSEGDTGVLKADLDEAAEKTMEFDRVLEGVNDPEVLRLLLSIHQRMADSKLARPYMEKMNERLRALEKKPFKAGARAAETVVASGSSLVASTFTSDKRLATKLEAFFVRTAFAQPIEVQSGPRVALRLRDEAPSTIFTYRKEGQGLVVVAPGAGIRIPLDTSHANRVRTQTAQSQATPAGVLEVKLMEDALTAQFLGAVQTETLNANPVVVEVDVDAVPGDFLRTAIPKVRRSKLGNGVYFVPVGGRLPVERALSLGVFDEGLPPDLKARGARTVLIQSDELSARTADVHLYLRSPEEGSVLSGTLLFLAVVAARIDLSNIPDWFVSAYAALSEGVDAATLKLILMGKATLEMIKRFAIRPLLQTTLQAAAQYYRNARRITEAA